MEDLSKVSTQDLCEELKRRKATQSLWVKPYAPFEIKIDGERIKTEIGNQGCCWIFVVWD